MSIFSPAYDVVLAASQALTPLFGAAATAATIVLATLAVRLLLLPLTFRQVRIERCRAELAPRVEKLRKLHHDDPLKALTETNALYRAEGVGTATTLLPLLAQSPFFLVLYSLFRKPSIDGHANALLQHSLLDVPLGSHWHSLVFAGVLALLAIVAAVSMRRLRRLGQSWLLAVTPFVTVLFAFTVPLAAALYLLTTTFWTALENALVRDRRGPYANTIDATTGGRISSRG